MKIFLAGASEAIGRSLTPLLRSAGHNIVGTTRSADKADALHALGAEPVVVDVMRLCSRVLSRPSGDHTPTH
jgi:uncharacterized protein YbjT (DUF2867 family)